MWNRSEWEGHVSQPHSQAQHKGGIDKPTLLGYPLDTWWIHTAAGLG